LHPTAARYRQIQQALASKGYYRGEIDGKWGPESVAALQQFQTEQGIENQGKITALALIGLGLGPKHKHTTIPVVSAETAQPADDSETNGGGQQESKSSLPGNAVTANQ
jgi:peptidoglycan hydrolase-like protein with peptidoglycan-binding domain